MRLDLSERTRRLVLLALKCSCLLLLAAIFLLERDTTYAQAQQAATLTRLVLFVELFTLLAVGYIENPR